MACFLTLYTIVILSILLIVPFTESSRCSNKCSFPSGLKLNSSISSDFCPSSNASNDNINQDCIVKLTIDFTTGVVNGSFDVRNQSTRPMNALDITTIFYLKNTSVQVDITYICSISDYCDLEFVRETLSPTLAAIQMEPIRQELAARLYDSNSTGPDKCSDNNLCPKNTTFCITDYSRDSAINGGQEKVESTCIQREDDPLVVIWAQSYTPYSRYGLADIGIFYCNTPNCGSNATIIEIFQWLKREYILPLNISLINITTTTSQSTTSTTTTSTTISTTTSNDGSLLFEHFNIVVLCFGPILFLYKNLFQISH